MNQKIFVAGHNGLVGSAIVRQLLRSGISPSMLITRSRAELDLTEQSAVRDFFAKERPEVAKSAKSSRKGAQLQVVGGKKLRYRVLKCGS